MTVCWISDKVCTTELAIIIPYPTCVSGIITLPKTTTKSLVNDFILQQQPEVDLWLLFITYSIMADIPRPLSQSKLLFLIKQLFPHFTNLIKFIMSLSSYHSSQHIKLSDLET